MPVKYLSFAKITKVTQVELGWPSYSNFFEFLKFVRKNEQGGIHKKITQAECTEPYSVKENIRKKLEIHYYLFLFQEL